MGTTGWQTVGDEAQGLYMRATSAILKTGHPPNCPVCKGDVLRFYYHEFAVEPRRRGTIWVWCRSCRLWNHMSRIQLADKWAYEDPFGALSLDEFGKVERQGLLDQTEAMWEAGELPQSFTPPSG